MLRSRDRHVDAGMFRGKELPRLLTMIVMLLVLAMMMRRARDVDTWRFLTGEPKELRESESGPGPATPPPIVAKPSRAKQPLPPVTVKERTVLAQAPADEAAPAGEPAPGSTPPASEPAEQPVTEKPAPAKPDASDSESSVAEPTESAAAVENPVAEPVATAAESEAEPTNDSMFQPAPAEKVSEDDSVDPGKLTPIDEDPAEREALAEEYSAVSDRTALTIKPEEMFAYYRLLRWADAQTSEELLKRARNDVRFDDLYQKPEQHRAELIKVKLHLERVLKEKAPEENPLGIEHYYQAVGWNDASQAWFYFCIFVDKPEGLVVGSRVHEEGTFVGYFFKTIVYLDGQGRRLIAPVLVGRMITPRKLATPQEQQNEEWQWTIWLGGGLVILMVGRTVWRFLPGRQRKPVLTGLLRRTVSEVEPQVDIEQWLDDVEAATTEVDSAINARARHESNGSADHGVRPAEADELSDAGESDSYGGGQLQGERGLDEPGSREK